MKATGGKGCCFIQCYVVQLTTPHSMANDAMQHALQEPLPPRMWHRESMLFIKVIMELTAPIVLQ
jgi:hypothetical protein